MLTEVFMTVREWMQSLGLPVALVAIAGVIHVRRRQRVLTIARDVTPRLESHAAEDERSSRAFIDGPFDPGNNMLENMGLETGTLSKNYPNTIEGNRKFSRDLIASAARGPDRHGQRWKSQRQGDVMNRSVVTRSANNQRHGAYTAYPTQLTAVNVAKRGVKRVTTIQTGPDARGCEAQPLYLENFKMPDGKVVDMVIVATMGNVLHAYDLRSGQYLWETEKYLGRPITGTRDIDFHMINDTWGILSTPVIDEATGRMYACMWSSADGDWRKGVHQLLEVDVTDGVILRRTTFNDLTTYSPGHGLPTQRFSSMQRKQRCSLLLHRGSVYVAFGTIAETGSGARGWVIRVETSTMRTRATVTTTSRGSGGGIWMAGQGLSADGDGYIYCTTGNGDFDGVTDFGECYLKFDPDTLKILDWWAAFSDDLRTGRQLKDAVGGDSAIAHTVEESADKNFIGKSAVDMGPVAGKTDMKGVSGCGMPGMKMGSPTNKRDYDLRGKTPSGAIAMGAAADMDLGSGGAQPIDRHNLVHGAGKDGVGHLVNKRNMGKTTVQQLRDGVQYLTLLGRSIFYTYYAGPGVSPEPKDIRDLNYLYNDGKTHHLHSTPVYHEDNVNGDVLFVWGENSPLKAYRIDTLPDGGKKLTWLADGREWASPLCTNPPGGMPGGMMCLSGDMGKSPVLWATVPYGDGNMTVTSGRLVAYDASNLSGGVIRKIWDSQDWNLQFMYNKFCPPTVAGDRLLVANYSGGVDVYELAS